MIALHAAIHDAPIILLSNSFTGNVLRHPVRKAPHGRVDRSELNEGVRIFSDCLFEFIVKFNIIEKDVRIVEETIEVSLKRAHRLDYAVNLLVAGEDCDNGIRTRRRVVNLLASRGEGLVICRVELASVSRLRRGCQNTLLSRKIET